MNTLCVIQVTIGLQCCLEVMMHSEGPATGLLNTEFLVLGILTDKCPQ